MIPPQAKRSGLDARRAVLRRNNPGFDAIIEIERDDLARDASAGEVGRGLATPQDPHAGLDRVDVAAAAVRGRTITQSMNPASTSRRSSVERAR